MASKQQPKEAPKKERKNLPTEILLIIFSYLDPDKNKQDLLSLSRASTQFSQLAQPFLFQTFSKNPHRVTEEFEPLVLFTQSILHRPDLANKVCRIAIRDIVTGLTDIYSDDVIQWPVAHSRETFGELSRAIQRLDMSDESKDWCAQEFQTLGFSPLLGVLFANLPKVEELCVTIKQSRWSKVATFLGFIGPTTNLKKINVVISRELPQGVDLQHLISVISQPKLEFFQVNHFMFNWPSLPLLPTELPSISTLALKECGMDVIALNYLLDSCNNLKSLTYSYRTGVLIYMTGMPINAIELEIVLRRTELNLKHLDVRFNLHRPETMHLARDVEFQGLDFLTDLEYLSVEQCCLTDPPMLPASLKTLILQSCDEPVINLVRSLAQESGRSLPNLRKVVVRQEPFACSRILDIHPPVGQVSYRSDAAARQLVREKVRELDQVAESGHFEFTIDCKLYNIVSNDMLNENASY